MTKIYFNLKNCHGIPEFVHVFESNKVKKEHLIYARNGVMKTSFANTLTDICLYNETKDCFYPSRKTIRHYLKNQLLLVLLLKKDHSQKS